MYFYALYKLNYVKSGDFSKVQNVEVPKMYDFNVNYLQDVSAYNSIDHDVIAANDSDAHFLWQNGLSTSWAARSLGNEIIEVEYDFFTGPATTSTSTTGIQLYNSDYSICQH